METSRLRTKLFTRGALALSLLLAFTLPGQAQVGSGTIGETDIRPFAIGGSITFLGRGYTVSGIDARRPPGTGQVRAATTFSLFGLQSGLNILYSTDDNNLRQSMNQISFRGSWRWISVTAGTVRPDYSRYSVSGIHITGGMVELTPGWFHLSLAGGRSRRAVPFSDHGDFRQESFERWLYAARMGFGDADRTFFFFTGMYARDATKSLDVPESIRPSSNVNITPGLYLSLFDNNLRLTGEVTASIFTRDTESTAVDLGDEVPAFLSDMLSARTSTRVDYAGVLSGDLSLGRLQIKTGYERVQPGFLSLGTGQVRSDQQMYNLSARMPVWQRRMNLSATFLRGRNNLLDQKLSTLHRQQAGTNIMVRLTQTLNVSLAFSRMANENKAVDPSSAAAPELHQKHISSNITLTPTLVVRSDALTHSISATAAYHVLDDKSELVLAGVREESGFTNATAGLSYGVTLPSALSLGLSGNLLSNTAGNTSSTGFSTNVTGGYSFLDRRLSTNASFGWSRNGIEFVRIVNDGDDPGLPRTTLYPPKNEGENGFMEGEYVVRQWSTQFTLSLSASYRLPNGNPLHFNLRGVSNQPGSDDGQSFRELQGSLQYTHRF